MLHILGGFRLIFIVHITELYWPEVARWHILYMRMRVTLLLMVYRIGYGWTAHTFASGSEVLYMGCTGQGGYLPHPACPGLPVFGIESWFLCRFVINYIVWGRSKYMYNEWAYISSLLLKPQFSSLRHRWAWNHRTRLNWTDWSGRCTFLFQVLVSWVGPRASIASF